MRVPFCYRERRIEAEWMDAVGEVERRRALGDLRRINRWLGGYRTLARCLREVARRGERLTLADVGAASGDAAAWLQRAYPELEVISIDRQAAHLHAAAAPRVAADAFCLPLGDGAVDGVLMSLFLHHFEDNGIVQLLKESKRVARRFVIVNDLLRHPVARHFLPATRWLLNWGPVALHDGMASVRAGFAGEDLRRLAEGAGLRQARVRVHLPWFRVSLVAATR